MPKAARRPQATRPLNGSGAFVRDSFGHHSGVTLDHEALALDARLTADVVAGHAASAAVLRVDPGVDLTSVVRIPVTIRKAGRALEFTQATDALRNLIRPDRAFSAAITAVLGITEEIGATLATTRPVGL